MLLKLTKDLRAMLDKGELVAVVSMHLSKAFDVIQHNLLLAKHKTSGVGERGFSLIKDYLPGETAESQDWRQNKRC